MNNKKLFVNHRRVEFQAQQKRSCGMRTKKSPKKCGSWMIWIFYSTLWPTRYSISLLSYGDICCLFLVLVIPFNSFVHFFFNFSLTHNISIHNFTTLNWALSSSFGAMKRSGWFTCIVWVAQHLWQSLSEIWSRPFLTFLDSLCGVCKKNKQNVGELSARSHAES